VCVCVCVCIHAYMNAHINCCIIQIFVARSLLSYIHTHTSICRLLWPDLRCHTYIYTHTCRFLWPHSYKHTYIHTHTCMHICRSLWPVLRCHTYKHTYIHAYTHTHIHTHMQVSVARSSTSPSLAQIRHRSDAFGRILAIVESTRFV
jgi:hypothetical protein